jgi:hypothetical protein
MLNYLLMIYRDRGPKKNDLAFYRPNIGQTVKARVGASRKEMPRESGEAK